MLSDDVIELLTAYVDGELSPFQREAALRYLHRSSEARELVRQLQEDARRVKQLPKHKVEPSLVPAVLQAITDLGVRPSPALRPERYRRRKPYVAAALAASLLLAVVGGVYYYAVDRNGGTQQAAAPAAFPSRPVEPPAVEPEPAPRKALNPLIAHVVEGVYSQFGAPIPPDRAFSVTFGELRGGGGAAPGQLAYELAKDRAVQLDVVVKDNPLALERLSSVFHDHGIKIILDPETTRGLKKAPAGEYWVYAENIAPDELAKMLKELSRDDNKMQAFKRTPFERVTVAPLTAEEKQQVSGKLGIEPTKLEPNTLEAKPPAATRWDRQAVVLPQRPEGAESAEVQGYVSQRHRPKPGTVQVLVKIRQAK